MVEPIRSKRINDLANAAPTPQNTPASIANSYIDSHASEPTISTIEEEGMCHKAAATVAGLVNNPALISMMQQKFSNLVGRSSGYIESLPQPVRSRITGLKGLQKDHSDLETEFRKEIVALEKKYAELYKPLYERRAKIVAGAVEPTEEELEKGHAAEEEDEDEEDDDEEKGEEDEAFESPIPADAKGIPEFWLTALKNLLPVADTITENDEKALKFLADIQVEYIEQPGFKLLFAFDDNEFFSNKVITKTYYYQDETTPDGDYIYDRAIGDKIEWRSDKNLTVRVEKKKQRNKHTKATRTVEKIIPVESFFNFFSPPIAPDEDADEEASDVPDDLDERLQLDYQLGEEIKDKLVPRAVEWYTGEALDFDAEEFDADDLEDYDDDDDEDGDDDDEEDEEDDDGDAKPKQEQAECKQS
ncbi:uncharacterized protein V1518DRAFT_394717 [Limtongia smithiae]|uniref:uncharacterized protein n=1 Tax=Limtongia smithiae TaxID=1125753 RepID=UPI0034CDDF13